ncbi:unnamed protein product [Zymoseptoria tritici ST99CH_1A5]|uniref:Uncharacterized protein n=1 Tax=Zymoseptoria tritici ST99CH_1A5 TaxID=1276529 RepID=A0A1Y6L783_ZYMTR|nr:unnamed protein product [Zymoseptoria tritici ST99CH_1A5]
MATSPAGGSPRLRTSERVPSTPSPEPPPTASAIQPCPLLGLSAELRNNIWELAYTFSTRSRNETDILKEPYPTPDLLLTCRQIKSEAIGFFEAAESRYWEQDLFVLEREFNEEKCRDVTAQLLRLDDSCVRRMENIYLELNRFEHRVQCFSIPETDHTAWELRIRNTYTQDVVTTIYAVGSELADIPWPRPRPSVGMPTEEDVSTMPEVMNAPPLAPREKIVQAWGAMVKCAGFVWKGMHVFEVCTVRTPEVTLGLIHSAHWVG